MAAGNIVWQWYGRIFVHINNSITSAYSFSSLSSQPMSMDMPAFFSKLLMCSLCTENPSGNSSMMATSSCHCCQKNPFQDTLLTSKGFSHRNTFLKQRHFLYFHGKTLWISQNMSWNGFFQEKHHSIPAVCKPSSFLMLLIAIFILVNFWSCCWCVDNLLPIRLEVFQGFLQDYWPCGPFEEVYGEQVVGICRTRLGRYQCNSRLASAGLAPCKRVKKRVLHYGMNFLLWLSNPSQFGWAFRCSKFNTGMG